MIALPIRFKRQPNVLAVFLFVPCSGWFRAVLYRPFDCCAVCLFLQTHCGHWWQRTLRCLIILMARNRWRGKELVHAI
jgi:hypothetical protein